MRSYIINGGTKLSGSVNISCAKNAVLPIMAASILTNQEVLIKNCPKIEDVLNMQGILKNLGVKVEFVENNLLIQAKHIKSYKVDSVLAKKLRSSVFMMGALVSRAKQVEIPYPGGCNIGNRPIDIHISALKAFGVSVESEDEMFIKCKVNRLKGADVTLCFPSVGATENAIICAVLARGVSVIRNCAKEPEIVDLANFLNLMGAKILGAGSKTIVIQGVKKLSGIEYQPISDRIEAGTFLLAGAISGGDVELYGINRQNILPLIDKICQSTCKVSSKNDIIYIKSGGCRKPFSLVTGPYPLFPTDLQAQTMAYCCLCEGQSVIRENVFEDRFRHVPELIKMGADIRVMGRLAVINGVKELNSASLNAQDLRGGAALVLAGISANGQSEINNVFHIERGYCDFVNKLKGLGADIRIKE